MSVFVPPEYVRKIVMKTLY